MTSSLPRGDIPLALLENVIVGLVNICGLREVTGGNFIALQYFLFPFHVGDQTTESMGVLFVG